jgi:hypothetical protein
MALMFQFGVAFKIDVPEILDTGGTGNRTELSENLRA